MCGPRPSLRSSPVCHHRAPGEPVDERRLPGARRAEQDERPGGPQQRANLVDPLARDVAHRVDGNSDGDALRLDELPEVVAHVELGEDDDGIGTAVPGGGEVALEAPRVEVLVEPGDEEDGVDVRDEDVLLGLQPGRLARDLRAPWEKRLDGEAVAGRVADDDPVADRGHPAPDLVVAHAAARMREPVADLRADVVAAAVLRDDASGRGSRARHRL